MRPTRPRHVRVPARVGLALGLPVCLAATVVGVAQPARAAATITVSTCDEAGLDAAVAQANTDNAGDTITFTCSGTIDLASTLNITGTMTLDGTGQQVTLDGQDQVGVLSVASGTFTLNNLTVVGGSASGLVNNGATVNITGSTFTANSAPDGGGLNNLDGGTVNITGSTFNLNRATNGNGGALNNNQGTVNITSSRFVANFSNIGEGSDEGGAIFTNGTMTITDSVFPENQGDGTVYAFGGTLDVTNTSVVDNFDTVNGAAIVVASHSPADISFSSFEDLGAELDVVGSESTVNVQGSILVGGCEGFAPADQGYNLESGTSCGFTGTGDVQNTAPDLTETGPGNSLVSPQGSPAIDAVPAALCPATDENGNPRPDDPSETSCDMGATESDYPPAGATLFSSLQRSPLGQPVAFTATFTPTDGGGTVAFYADGSTTPISECGAQALTQVTGSTYEATCTTSSLPLGTHAISAVYSGDSAYSAITGNLAGGQDVVPPILPSLSSSANPSVYGQPVTFTATIVPSDGSGTVAFTADGNPIPGCTGQPLTLLGGTDYTATCTTSSLAVNPAEGISASYLAGNLSLALHPDQRVNPAPLTAGVVGSQAYGGSPVFTVTGYSGLVNGDTPAVVTGTLAGCATTVGPGAGVGVHSGTISGCAGLSSPDYTISYADAGLTVSPAPLTAQVAGSQPYGGSPVFTVTGYSGLVNGDTPAVVTGTLAGCATTVGPGAGVGSYPGTISGCSGLSSPNYTLSYADAGLTVGAAPLTITASSGPMTYGGTPPVITPAYSGFVSGDGPGSLSTAPSCSTTATSASPAGTYPSSCAGATAADYAISYLPGTVTVGQAPQAISLTAPATGVVGKTATLAATGGASGNPVTLTVDPASGTGVCTVTGDTLSYTAAGSCVIDANQAGTANYTPAPQVTATITVNQAPAFVLASPPLTAVAGQLYDYTFTASGIPAPSYALTGGAPSWLAINPATGEVTGTPPSGTTTFTYTVTATSTAGTATAGPFTITVTKPSPNADLSAALACPTAMTVGGTGTCTLTVANAGPATTTKVIAAVALPAALSQTSCTPGCTRHANVYTWTLASLASRASAAFTITLKASKTGTAPVLAAAASQNPDPNPLNNITISQISIKH
jgi:hypothetical protein